MGNYYQGHREKRKEYQRKYRQKHKGEIREYLRKYRKKHKEGAGKQREDYQKHKEKTKERQKRYYQEHRERIREYLKKYRQENKEEIAERREGYYQKKKIKRKHGKLGDFLIRKLEELNKTKTSLASQSGVSYTTVYMYLSGYDFPKKREIKEKLCRALEIEVSELEKLAEN